MQEDRKCPYCGTINRGLDLKESNGLYICSKCEALIDTKADYLKDKKMVEKKFEKK